MRRYLRRDFLALSMTLVAGSIGGTTIIPAEMHVPPRLRLHFLDLIATWTDWKSTHVVLIGRHLEHLIGACPRGHTAPVSSWAAAKG